MVQTIYDIIKAGELKVETREARPDDPRLNDSVGQAVGRGKEVNLLFRCRRKAYRIAGISFRSNNLT